MGEFDTVNYPYYRIKELNTLCVESRDYRVYGLPVRAYWHEAESAMIRGMSEVLKTAAASGDHQAALQYITDYCNSLQAQAFSDEGKLLNAVKWYRSKNSNTLKNGRNPETHEVLDELKEVTPLQVQLDPSFYRTVPHFEG